MPTALITGILGQDGSYLSELLRQRGYRVVGVDVVAPSTALDGAEFIQADVGDLERVVSIVSAEDPDAIYHLAGQSSVGRSFTEPAGTFRSIATSTLNVLEAVRLHAPRARVLVAGSGEVFGDTQGVPATETTAPRPVSPYGAAKAAALHTTAVYRSAFGVYACTALFYNHESPRRPPQFVTQKIVRGACAIADGRADRLELGDTSVIRDFGWAPDYADAALRMLAQDEPRDLLIATGESHSLDEFVERVFAAVGLSARAHVKSQASLRRPAEIPAMLADPGAAATAIAWRASVRFDELVARLVAAERARLAEESGRP
jgi:GDPmannose 4,6-dehydratase